MSRRRTKIKTYNILGAAKLLGNGTEGGRDDGLVEGHEKDGNAQREHRQRELQRAGVHWLLLQLLRRRRRCRCRIIMLLFAGVLQTVRRWRLGGGGHCGGVVVVVGAKRRLVGVDIFGWRRSHYVYQAGRRMCV